MNTRDVIGQLLSNLGTPQEVAQYQRLYSDKDSLAVVVIKVGGAILDDDTASLTTALGFLREIGMCPVVVHGGGPQLTRALAQAGRPTSFVDGHRVTDAPTLEIARRVFHQANLALVEALNLAGVAARPVVSGVVLATQSHDVNLGLIGDEITIDPEPLLSALRSGQIPCVPPLGETASGQILNVDTDHVTEAISLKLRPHKVLFLTATGGLLGPGDRPNNLPGNKILDAINLLEDGKRLLDEEWVTGPMRHKLTRIWRLLEDLGPDASVSITSPKNLARELFTHQGAGTLVRLGERIACHASFDVIDKESLSGLMETCFGRPLLPTYFDDKTPRAIYLAESCRGAAIITEDLGGDAAYLDKFGVTDRAQGAGVGATLWNRLAGEHPRLVWRSRSNNPINGWYLRKADGAHRRGQWVVFWRGLSFTDALPLVEKTLLLPATLDVVKMESGHGARNV